MGNTPVMNRKRQPQGKPNHSHDLRKQALPTLTELRERFFQPKAVYSKNFKPEAPPNPEVAIRFMYDIATETARSVLQGLITPEFAATFLANLFRLLVRKVPEFRPLAGREYLIYKPGFVDNAAEILSQKSGGQTDLVHSEPDSTIANASQVVYAR